jgi:hypothetical protein
MRLRGILRPHDVHDLLRVGMVISHAWFKHQIAGNLWLLYENSR